MNTQMPIECCETCNAWMRSYVQEKPEEEPKALEMGECRAGPPTLVVTQWSGSPGQVVVQPGQPPAVIYQILNFGTFFPQVPPRGWCRKYERKPAMNA